MSVDKYIKLCNRSQQEIKNTTIELLHDYILKKDLMKTCLKRGHL